ncbi:MULTISPECIES: hypothetical protein [Pseudomonas]|uniref:hypothetical protein n=1 Tax=Pseudomonas TaxID=286 RepID=UPI003905EB9C
MSDICSEPHDHVGVFLLLGVWQILLCYAFNKNLSAIQWRQNGTASYAMHGVMKKILATKVVTTNLGDASHHHGA